MSNMSSTKLELLEVFGGVNVLLLAAGLALVEAGRSRKKNVSTGLTRQLACLFLSVTAFWIVGYAFAFSKGSMMIGYMGHYALHETNSSSMSHFFLHSMLATLPSSVLGGAVAERTHFTGHLVLSVVLSGLLYPMAAHWVWNPQGWLNVKGCLDIGGILPVHVLSGAVAITACAIAGRRKEKYGANFRKDIHGHSLPLAYIGGTLIIFGMIGKSIGLAASYPYISIGKVVANCLISGAGAGSLAIILYKISVSKNTIYDLRDLSQNEKISITNRRWSFFCCLNGCFAGLVAVQGGVGLYPMWGAWVIGLTAGCLYFMFNQLIVFCRLDDVTESIPVHLSAGIFGILVAPLVADREVVRGETGYLVAWGAAGFASTFALVAVVSAAVIALLLFIGKFRVTSEVEKIGADIFKMEEQAYTVAVVEQTENFVGEKGSFYFERSPGLSPIQKAKHKPVGAVKARTAVVFPCSTAEELSSTRRISGKDIQELAKSAPRIVVEAHQVTAQLVPPPPPPPKRTISLTSVNTPTIIAPPSSPNLSSNSQNSHNSIQPVPFTATVDELRATLQQQKKRLKATTNLMRKPSNTLADREMKSESSFTEPNEAAVQTIASNHTNFNYLKVSGPVLRVSPEKKENEDDVFDEGNDASNVSVNEGESGFGESMQSNITSAANLQASAFELKKMKRLTEEENDNSNETADLSALSDKNASEVII